MHCTSPDRPDDDDFAADRGTAKLRSGTGYVWGFCDSEYMEPCSCDKCGGKVKKKRKFYVHTARHVVYNAEEARRTKVDLFYDDDKCLYDGSMKSVWGVDLSVDKPDRDWCKILCVTCDEDLVERIASSFLGGSNFIHIQPQDISDLGLLPSCNEDCDPVLIVSHPHARPKKITAGEVRRYQDVDYPRLDYTTPTCPGSSGANVFAYDRDIGEFSYFLWSIPVHSGSFAEPSLWRNLLRRLFNRPRRRKTTPEQLNYAHDPLLGSH
ncbi:hypothetical protein ElyMa_003631700 [Elysia marginata]|uniref:C2H2-type domain-containing protein n=1 Tax=Elysia marginata TaxID=1093978 RepID=A0AAV4EUI0_9GAST|nr:hypothetical protein ElyMa_003631700 [Elysia marginata]